MENASKALLIAGGILLAMLVAAMLVLLNNNIQTLRTAQSDKTFHEQLVAFNMQYEAYNKKIMYGTDVISVVNKAIDNNNFMNLQNGVDYDELPRGYVNIKIITTDTFQTEIKRFDESQAYPEEDDVTGDFPDALETELANKHITIPDTTISFKGTETMGTWNKTATGDTLIMDDSFTDFFTGNPEDYVFPNVGGYTYYIYSALTNFKRAVFTCSNVEYDNMGRIHELTFTQVQETH